MTNSPLKTYDHTKPHRRHDHRKRRAELKQQTRIIHLRSCSVSFGQGKWLLVSPVTERWPTPIHKAEQANNAVCEKTHGTSITNRMITPTGMMIPCADLTLGNPVVERDSCELDLLGRMHPSESSGFPFWESYPRLSVCSCISVMKAIIAHPLR